MSDYIRRMLGETVEDAVDQDLAGAGETNSSGLTPGESIPVDTLYAMWERGDKVAVAVRVLDALDSYQQFVELCFRIGHAGGMELGGLMDEMTSEEKSPHQYDIIPDADLATKFVAGKGPKPGPSTHRATGESLTARKLLGR